MAGSGRGAQVGMELLKLCVEALPLDLETADVVGRRRHPDLLGEREEREHERDDDHRKQEPGPCCHVPPGTDRATGAAAWQRRRRRHAVEVGADAAARWRAGVRPDRRPSISRRSRSRNRGVRGSRNDSGSDGAPNPTVLVEGGRLGVLRAVVSLVDFMLATAVGLTPPVVMSLLMGSSFRTWCRLRGESFGGPQASAAGAWIGLDLGRRRHDRLGRQEAEAGVRPHTQTGSSGGQTQPRRSAAKKRLTIRSSSEW